MKFATQKKCMQTEHEAASPQHIKQPTPIIYSSSA